MNLLDIVFFAALAAFILAGWYRGFLFTVISIGAYVVSGGLALLFMPLLAAAVRNTDSLYNMMLYYTEGAEKIANVELSRMQIASLSSEELNSIIAKSELPFPLDNLIKSNIATEAFSDMGISTLGDYFNQTIVCAIINILCFLVLFIGIRIILSFILNGIDYAAVLPQLRHSDGLIGAGFGLVRGMLALFLLMMAVPLVLTVLPFDFIRDTVESSFFGPFFYHLNFLLHLMPGM